eukprot:10812357-Alexandrium_andersonii.AAC.1
MCAFAPSRSKRAFAPAFVQPRTQACASARKHAHAHAYAQARLLARGCLLAEPGFPAGTFETSGLACVLLA